MIPLAIAHAIMDGARLPIVVLFPMLRKRGCEQLRREALIQTDHVTNDADLTEETDPAKLRPDGKIWSSLCLGLVTPSHTRTSCSPPQPRSPRQSGRRAHRRARSAASPAEWSL